MPQRQLLPSLKIGEPVKCNEVVRGFEVNFYERARCAKFACGIKLLFNMDKRSFAEVVSGSGNDEVVPGSSNDDVVSGSVSGEVVSSFLRPVS